MGGLRQNAAKQAGGFYLCYGGNGVAEEQPNMNAFATESANRIGILLERRSLLRRYWCSYAACQLGLLPLWYARRSSASQSYGSAHNGRRDRRTGAKDVL